MICSTCEDTGWVDTVQPQHRLGAQPCPDCDQRPTPVVQQPPYASLEEVLKIEQGLANITGRRRHIRKPDGAVLVVVPNAESPYLPGATIEVITHQGEI